MSARPRLPITTTSEGGGVVLTCACSWLRWVARGDVDGARGEHEKKCKVARGES